MSQPPPPSGAFAAEDMPVGALKKARLAFELVPELNKRRWPQAIVQREICSEH